MRGWEEKKSVKRLIAETCSVCTLTLHAGALQVNVVYTWSNAWLDHMCKPCSLGMKTHARQMCISQFFHQCSIKARELDLHLTRLRQLNKKPYHLQCAIHCAIILWVVPELFHICVYEFRQLSDILYISSYFSSMWYYLCGLSELCENTHLTF